MWSTSNDSAVPTISSISASIAGICEERQIPYIYTPSRRHLGLAVGYARPMIVVLLKRKDDYGELYDEIVENANALSVA